MAWDICKNVKGQEYADAAFFAKCGAIAKRLGITWGGTWDTPDKPHFEVTKDWKGKGESEVVEKCKMIINGKEYTVERILKDGTNYIKIRDVAEAIGYDVTSKGNVAVLTKK
jgi:peptidoglycan L-alanyl-D-glutamate endopeptidase CwlK